MKQRGFTLLETLLTLALVVVVLGLLGMAVDVHLRVTDATCSEVEQSQSARLILRQMADDLRNAIPVAQAPSSIGCLRGNRQELQVDISHLPLLDEMQTAASSRDNTLLAPPSDVRTVTYCVAKPEGSESPQATDLGERRRGLLRREWERATFAWAVQQGRNEALNRSLKVLSPEVDAIEFTYLSGSTAYAEWDSLKQGKLPAAVKIAVSLRPSGRRTQRPSMSGTIEKNPSTTYEMLVDLPNARATLDQAIAAVSEQSASTSGQAQSSDPTSQDANSQSTGIKEVKPMESNSGGGGQ